MPLSTGPNVSIHTSRPKPLTAAPGGYRVLLGLGQSNMVDQSPDDAAVAWPDGVLVMDTITETYAPPAPPLRWLERTPGASQDWDSGPGQSLKHFAIDWCAANPGETLIVLPAARGGTGFDGDWTANGTGALYDETIRLLDKLFTDYPQASFAAAVMQHGERDASNDNRCYLWNALEMVAKIRARYGAPELPFIWGEPGQFSSTTGAGFDAVRTQIRALPTFMHGVATARSEDSAAYDALNDLGDGLHFDQPSQKVLGALDYAALATATANAHTTLPSVAHIWQTAGEPNWTAFDIVCDDLAAGDTLLVLALAHRSTGQPFINTLSANGDAATLHLGEFVQQTRRIGASVASVTLSSDPAGGIVPLAIDWQSNPTGGVLSVWRVRGAASFPAGSIARDYALGPMSTDLTANLPGTVAALAYAVDTTAAQVFLGDGQEIVGGPGSTNAVYFSARQLPVAGPSATFSVAPSSAPSHVCGMIAVGIA